MKRDISNRHQNTESQRSYCRKTAEIVKAQKEAVKHWYDEQYETVEWMMKEIGIPEETRKLILDKCPKKKNMVVVYKNLIRELIPGKELSEYTYQDTETVQLRLADPIYKNEQNLFTRLMKAVGIEDRMTDVRIINHKKKRVDDAMSLEDYTNLAILVFNPKYTPELMQKSLKSRKQANQWLILATLFVCSHRISDIRSMPAAGLMDSLESTEALLNKGELPADIAEKYVAVMEMKYDHTNRTPGKTSEKRPGNLKFVVPDEYRQVYGTILAINALHYYLDPQEDFIKPDLDISYRDLVDLLGDGVKILNGGVPKSLSTKSVTKRRMQELADVAEAVYDSKMFYLIPGISRSHKTDIGRMSESTWHYLDCKIDSLDTDEIMIEIMKRGIGSAQLIKVLESGTGDAYEQLDAKTQTEAILQLKAVTDAYDVEAVGQMAYMLETQIQKDEARLMELISKDKEQAMFFVRKLVSGIASGKATAKNQYLYCMRMACGKDCDKDDCIGCGEEIYTKRFFTKLIEDIENLNERTLYGSPQLKRRAEAIVKTKYYPALLMILKAIKEAGGPVDVYLDIMNGKQINEVQKIC